MLFLLAGLFSFRAFAFFPGSDQKELDFSVHPKSVKITDNGLDFEAETSFATVKDVLDENHISIGSHDRVTPDTSAAIIPGLNIEISRASKIRIEADGKTIETYTFQKNIAKALDENSLSLGRLDKTTPEKNTPISDNLSISVTRINIEEVVIPENIVFKTITKLDAKLGWQEKKTEQEGADGTMEVKYQITYRNGKEVSRVALEKNKTKDPTPEIITQGTYVKLGDKHTGLGTWYAFQGGMYAASPWLPIGSFAKVTNAANGKSVIVKINDRGPFGKNRILDLDKIAFQKIASLGAGVINLKVEEVLN